MEAKLEVQFKYSRILFALLGCAMIFCIFLPYLVFESDNSTTEQILSIVWPIAFGSFAAVCFVGALCYYQVAIINERGIKIKSMLGKIVDINWEDILRIRIEKLATMSSSVKVLYYDWIVLYTNSSQEAVYGGKNVRKKGPWQIRASEKNKKVISIFCKQYCPRLNFLTNLDE